MTTTTYHIDTKCLACRQPLSAKEIDYWQSLYNDNGTEHTVVKALCRRCWARYQVKPHPLAK